MKVQWSHYTIAFMINTLRPTINLETHLLEGVQFVISPNYDERPNNELPSLVVVHGISLPPNKFGGKGVEQLFTNHLDVNEHPYYQEIKDLKVSAHLFIRRGGETIQFVPFHLRAWHSGISEFQGRQKCNDFSVGIELEGTDKQSYTQAQYLQLAKVIRALREVYPKIKSNHLVGHSEIAPGRKTDPGQFFSWQKLENIIKDLD